MQNNNPIALTSNFFQLGTHNYPSYLSLGEEAMIIEGGISATTGLIVEQVLALGIDPQRIKYIVITHTHPDHIGAIPRLKKLWPHIKVVASPVAAGLLASEEKVTEFHKVDSIISEILIVKNEIKEWPEEFPNPSFKVDITVREGDVLDIGHGIVWKIFDTPGHSSCHISLYNEREGILHIADAVGLYQPECDRFWPNYFDSLETFCSSIRKLLPLQANIGSHGHHGVVRGDISQHLAKGLEAAGLYHANMLNRLQSGDDPKKVAFEIARSVYTFTNLQPFEVIFGLSRLMMKRSQAAAANGTILVRS